jgi:hypothetical protein
MSNRPQTTPISQLLAKDEGPQRPQMQMQMQMPSQDPSGQFGNLPQMGGPINTRPMTNMMPSGVGQGVSMPEGMSRKEFFGLKEVDWKSGILVFALILILSSGIFSSCVRSYVPGAVGSDARTTLVGSLVAAVIGVIIFYAVKFLGKW